MLALATEPRRPPSSRLRRIEAGDAESRSTCGAGRRAASLGPVQILVNNADRAAYITGEILNVAAGAYMRN